MAFTLSYHEKEDYFHFVQIGSDPKEEHGQVKNEVLAIFAFWLCTVDPGFARF